MTAGIASRPALLVSFAAWLRYDETRVAEVEEAYTVFLRRAKFGWFFLGALSTTLVAAAILALVHRGEPASRLTGEMLPILICTFYGIQAVPLFLVPRSVLATMLRGCVDVRRAIAVGALLGLAASIVEFAFLVVLTMSKAKQHVQADPFANGIAFGLFLMLFAAPFVEEFAMQGWLQSRLRPAGAGWAGVLTTVAFVLMHVPTSLFDIVRGVVLGFAAILRGTTRSLAACIAVHFTNNAVFGCILLATFAFGQGHHVPHGSHR
jgi:membrane protease YdiL (CAAX protease family)